MKKHFFTSLLKIPVYLSGAIRIPLALHAHCRAVALSSVRNMSGFVSKLPAVQLLHPAPLVGSRKFLSAKQEAQHFIRTHSLQPVRIRQDPRSCGIPAEPAGIFTLEGKVCFRITEIDGITITPVCVVFRHICICQNIGLTVL